MEYRAVIRSELKQKIMLSLLNGEKRISELSTDVGSTETTILHALKEFENLALTTKNSGLYSLTSLGRIEAQVCRGSFRATNVIGEFKDFWLTHDVSPIPPKLMLQIGALYEANLVKTESSELGKVHETFLKMIVNTKKVIGTSPIFHPDFVGAFKMLLEQGGSMELILTNEVLNKTFELALVSDEGELFQKFLHEGQLSIYLADDLKVALTVTEHIFSMGLYDLNNQYDYSMDLISEHPEALEWGEELFQEYIKKAKKIEM